MVDVTPLVPLAPKPPDARSPEPRTPAIRNEAIYAVLTSPSDTLVAVRAADSLAKRMAVPLTLVAFCTTPDRLPLDATDRQSPLGVDALVTRLRDDGVDIRVRQYLCRDERRAIPMAFRRHSLIVIAGRRRWWPTPADRWRRWLEAAGHFVVFVDASAHREAFRA